MQWSVVVCSQADGPTVVPRWPSSKIGSSRFSCQLVKQSNYSTDSMDLKTMGNLNSSI